MAFSLEKAAPVENFEIHPTKAESPSVLHYTSGTTGQPKGVKHVHYSLIAQYLTAKWVLDIQEDDIYWCTADPGWVTGTSYGIIGPWSLGVTQCVLDCRFFGRSLVQVHREAQDHDLVFGPDRHPVADEGRRRDRQEIRPVLAAASGLASASRLNPEAVIWSETVFGMPFHDTYWQTETGSIMITNFPGMKIKPGSMGKPFPGITADVVDPKTYEPFRETGKDRPDRLQARAGRR